MRIVFNGKEYKKNGRNGSALKNLCFDIFQYYLEQHKDLNYQELQDTFNEYHCNNNYVVLSEEDWKSKTEDLKSRYFDPITYNSQNYYFTIQWDNNGANCDNIDNMIDFAVKHGYDIKILEDERIKIKVTKVKQQDDFSTKNIMLYGVPGVGKTHNYKRLIAMIENGESEQTIFSTIANNSITNEQYQETFEAIKKEKRIEFVTFHQSYSYEDFIEGFRPNDSGNIKLEDGIFKRLCDNAQVNLLKATNTKDILFVDAINLLLKKKIENQESIKIDLKRKDSFFKIYDYNDKTIYFEKQNGDQTHTLSMKTLEKMYYEEENNIIQGGLAPYYNPLLDQLLKLKKTTDSEKVEQKNFYIVIDEINRGNISKIFGELITLIEEDKRDTYEVTLPYSKEKFKIPSNLYIVATMNSTDKSIATIDIALRRRFTFLKMQSNEGLIDYFPAKDLFNQLNKFIAENLNEDYKLGHSYFMKITNNQELEFVKEYKIKPLLEEYFYVDPKKLQNALDILNKDTYNE